jgi:ribosome-associated inhibitor A
MTIEITGKSVDITPAIRERFEFKFNKLEKYQVPMMGKHVTITEEPNRQFKIETSANIPGGQLVASAEHDDLFGAITEVFAKLERQLNKQTHKPTARRASHSDRPEPEEAEVAEESFDE